MQRVQQMVLGLRETVVRVEVIPHTRGVQPDTPGLVYRCVTPDNVYCEVDPDQPDIPVYYREYRIRLNPITNEQEWVCDVIDIRNMNEPMFGMFLANKDGSLGEDVSELYMGHPTHRGADFPFRNALGQPFLPLTVYHAEKTGELWNFLDGNTLVYGSLNSAVLYTMFLHCVRDNAWAQKYMLGASVAGLNAMDQDLVSRRAAVSTDPSSILILQSDPDTTGQPLVGTFSPPIKPDELLESVAKYELRVAVSSGIAPESLTRQNADPRSGYALSIDRAGQREAQRNTPQFFEWVTKTCWPKVQLFVTDTWARTYQKAGIVSAISRWHLDRRSSKLKEKTSWPNYKLVLSHPLTQYKPLTPTWTKPQLSNFYKRFDGSGPSIYKQMETHP